MKILVTGGEGYIGKILCEVLRSRGHSTIVIDSFENTPEKDLPPDLEDRMTLISDALVYEPEPVDCVVHLAAFSSVGYCEEFPEDAYDSNVKQMYWLLKRAVLLKIRKFIFASSCAVYGNSHVPNPISVYGRTKQIGEMMLWDLAKSIPIKYALRLSNVAGAMEVDGQLMGENYKYGGRLITNLCKYWLGMIDKPMVNPSIQRDFIHIKAVIDLLVRLIEQKDSSDMHTPYTYDVCSGINSWVSSITDILRDLTGVAHRLDFTNDQKPYDPLCTIRHASNPFLVKINPPLREIVESAYNWHALQKSQATKGVQLNQP